MIVFENIKYKNILSTGNQFNSISLNDFKTNLIIGKNGEGKCLFSTTPIRVRNKITNEILDITVGEFFKLQEGNSGNV